MISSKLDGPLHWAAGASSQEITHISKIITLAEMERVYIETILQLCYGNISRAAKLLDISVSTLYRKKAKWGKEQEGLLI